jgi:hypothetical protein
MLSRRRVAVLAWRVGFCAWLTLTMWPVTYGVTRLAQCVLFAALFVSAWVLWWNARLTRWCLLCLVVIATAFLCLPGRVPNPAALRLRYVAELQRFQGVRYIWGGENRFGIDCSGLARRAWINTLWREGVGSANPSLVRRAAFLWWRDASARALAAEHDGQTQRIKEYPSVFDVNPAELSPGDLAITSDGVHVLAFVGQDRWIEADPGERKVIILRAPDERLNPESWLRIPVTLVRWKLLNVK